MREVCIMDTFLKTEYETDIKAREALLSLGCTLIGDCLADPELHPKAPFWSGYWWVGKDAKGNSVYAHFSKYDRG